MRYLYNQLRLRLKNSPMLFRPIAAFKDAPGQRVVTPQTDIVIEGVARSGNTFAVEAFRVAQSGPVSIAHHFHAAAQVLLGIRWNIPTIVLIRRPRDAVISQMVFYPLFPPAECLREYISFYSRLMPYRSQVVLGPFDEVVRDYGAVIARVNEKYEASFAPYVESRENTDTVFGMIEEAGRREGHGVREIAHPLEGREVLKRDAAKRLQRCGTERLMERATSLFDAFVGDQDFAA